jgi:hypothetical protein
MLIVLAVLVVISSMSWPALRKSMFQSELRDAARQLRDALARARLEAIESGAPKQFRYQPGTGRFEISALSATEGGEGPALVAAEGPADDPLGRDDSLEEPGGERHLPGDVLFFDPEVLDQLPLEPDPLVAQTEERWSPPVIFYPNGRTFNARIRLAGAANYYVDVTLRGLTGAAKVGRIERLEEAVEDRGLEPMEGLR